MAGLGPRVGGAHVDVNLKFDDRSVSTVGKQIHRQLSQLNDRLKKIGDQNREIYRSIGRDAVVAWRALLGTLIASAPLMGSLISGVAGSATMLAGALYSAVQSSYGFAPLLAAIGVAAGTAAIGLNGFFDAIKSGNVSDLTPSAAAAAAAIRSLKDEWESLRDVVQERMFKDLADDFARLGDTLFPVLERGLGKMADAWNGLAQSVLDYLNSTAGLRVINQFLDNSADIFSRLSEAAVPFLDGFLRLLNALAPAGKRLADRIAEIARNFQDWASAPGFAERIDDMMRRAEKTAGLLFTAIGNLGVALANVFNAANPATNTFLTMLVNLTEKFKEWTRSVEGQDAIAKWADSANEIMAQFGETLDSVLSVLGKLADPRVIISFLETVEIAFDHLNRLPIEKAIDAFVILAEKLQPISGLFLAIVIGAAAFNITIGVVAGQLAGIASALGRVVGPLGKFVGKLGGVGKHRAAVTGLTTAFTGFFTMFEQKGGKHLSTMGRHSKDVGKLATALGKVGAAFSRIGRFAGPPGLLIWLGSVALGSDDVKKKFGELGDELKDFAGSFKKAFDDIKEALKPLQPAAEKLGDAFGKLFDIMDGWGAVILVNGIETLIIAFEGLGKMIEGTGESIAGFINIFAGLFTANPQKIVDGMKQVFGGIGTVLLGMLQGVTAPLVATFKTLGSDVVKGFLEGLGSVGDAIATFVGWIVDGVKSLLGIASPSTVFMQIGVWVIQGLINGVTSMLSSVLSIFSGLVSSILGFFGGLPGQLASLGGAAISALGNAFGSGVSGILSTASKIFSGITGWIGRLPGNLSNLGKQAVTSLSGAVRTGISKVTGIANSIRSGAVTALSSLPGKLFSTGTQAVTRLGNALRTGISTAKTIATNIGSAIKNALTGIPGDMLGIGRSIVTSLTAGLASKLGALRSMASSIGGLIKGVLPGSPVEYGPLTAWNRGGGATGGGRNVIDAITAGLRDTAPIKKAMNDIASTVGQSMSPSSGGLTMAGGSSITNTRNLAIAIHNPAPETSSDSLTRTTRNLAYLGLS